MIRDDVMHSKSDGVMGCRRAGVNQRHTDPWRFIAPSASVSKYRPLSLPAAIPHANMGRTEHRQTSASPLSDDGALILHGKRLNKRLQRCERGATLVFVEKIPPFSDPLPSAVELFNTIIRTFYTVLPSIHLCKSTPKHNKTIADRQSRHSPSKCSAYELTLLLYVPTTYIFSGHACN